MKNNKFFLPKKLEKPSKSPLAAIFFTIFLDLIGVGIVIPLLAIIFIGPNSILPESYSLQSKTFLLGLLISSYPLAQFFGAPILGAMSDRYGRKKILLLSLCGTLTGYILFGFGIIRGNVYLLFLSRILDGFTGGNISISLSAIADISDNKSKAANFGLVGMAAGLGFILGPFAGGKLSDANISSYFNQSTPFWFAAALTLINIMLVIWRFPETLAKKTNKEINILAGFKNISKAFKMKSLRTMFIVIFLLSFGFNFFAQFFPVFLIKKFSYSQSQIGDIFAFIGLWIAIAQGGITRPLSKKINSVNTLSFSALLLGIVFPILILPKKSFLLYFILPFIAIFQGLTYPNSTAIISSLSDEKSQGEILGINQSMQSLAQSIPPIIAGIIVSINPALPIITASIVTFVAWIIFVVFFRSNYSYKKVND